VRERNSWRHPFMAQRAGTMRGPWLEDLLRGALFIFLLSNGEQKICSERFNLSLTNQDGMTLIRIC
jgi:hypothetical protein